MNNVEAMLNNGCPSAMLANGVVDSFDIVELAVMEKGLKNSGIYDFNEEADERIYSIV